MDEITSFDSENLLSSNEILTIKVSYFINDGKYLPSLHTLITNNKNETLNIIIEDSYLISADGIQYDLSHDKTVGRQIEILPFVSKKSVFSFVSLSEIGKFLFKEGDRFIFSFSVNNVKYALMYKLDSSYFVKIKDDYSMSRTFVKDGIKYEKKNNNTLWLVIFGFFMIFIPALGLLYLILNIIMKLSATSSKAYYYKDEAIYKRDMRYNTGSRHVGNRNIRKEVSIPMTTEDKKSNLIIGITYVIFAVFNIIFMLNIFLK